MWFIKDGEKKDDQQTDIKKWPFSKVLLIQESILMWLITLSCLVMAFICIAKDSYVELPWISAIVACPWGAYAITQNAYYKKSCSENTKGGIIYDSRLGLFGAKQTDSDEPVG